MRPKSLVDGTTAGLALTTAATATVVLQREKQRRSTRSEAK